MGSCCSHVDDKKNNQKRYDANIYNYFDMLCRSKQYIFIKFKNTPNNAIVVELRGSYKSIMGWDEEKIIGRNYADLMHPDDINDYIEKIRLYNTKIKSLVELNFPVRYKHSDGSYITLMATGDLIDGYWYCIFKPCDEKEFNRYKITEYIKENTTEIFMSYICHEIRNVSNGVLGMLQLLNMTNLDVQQKKYIDIAQENGSFLVDTLNSILLWNSLNNESKINFETVSTNVCSIISDIKMSKVTEIDDKNILLFIDCNCDKQNIILPKVQLNQIILNLIGNAIKFTPPHNKIYISISKDKTKKNISFTIKNTGIGIEKDNIHCITQPYKKLNQQEKGIQLVA